MTTTTALVSLFTAVVGIVLTNALHRLRASYEVRYARLYERRAEVIDELHKRLVRTGEALGIWAYWRGGGQVEQREAFFADLQDFNRYYREHSLWLDNQTRQKLDAFVNETVEVMHLLSDLTDKPSLEEWEDMQSGMEHPMTKAEARTWLLKKRGRRSQSLRSS
jgi:hypothetical protein